ncbi:hypothetical protein L6V77_04925 [Myxococcota bacterium]|nr:hypothetical protein [Myxococcota bacterium]
MGSNRPGSGGRLFLLALAVLLWVPCPAVFAAPAPILTREEEAARKADEAEREAIIALIYQERLLQVPPDTFHAPTADPKRSVAALVEDLLFLDLAVHLLEQGGVENIDRLRAAAQTWRARATRDAARSREALVDRLGPSRDELTEAARTALSVAEVAARGEERTTGAVVGTAPSGTLAASATAPVAPLDYIPVPPEDLAALRERYMASGRPVDEAWYNRLARDPIAEERWKQQQAAMEKEVARLQTGWKTEKGAGYQIGVWTQDVWQRKDPLGLAVIFVFLLGAGAAGFVVFKLIRRDR